MDKRLARINKTGILCIIVAIIILIINLLQKVKWYEYISVAFLIVAGIIFIYTSNKLRIKELTKNKTKSK